MCGFHTLEHRILSVSSAILRFCGVFLPGEFCINALQRWFSVLLFGGQGSPLRGFAHLLRHGYSRNGALPADRFSDGRAQQGKGRIAERTSPLSRIRKVFAGAGSSGLREPAWGSWPGEGQRGCRRSLQPCSPANGALVPVRRVGSPHRDKGGPHSQPRRLKIAYRATLTATIRPIAIG